MPSEGSSKSSSERPRSKRSKSDRPSVEDQAKQARKAAKAAGAQATEAATKASKAVATAANTAAEALGGWRQLDKYVKDYNPTFYEFVDRSFLKRFEASNKPSKFLACLVGLGIAQSTLPVFAWPLDSLARLLSFLFLYNTGIAELKNGFGTSDTRASKVKSLITAYLLVTVFDILPLFAFATVYHFGAMWSFLLPAAAFITPDRKKPKETLAVWLADSIFGQISAVIDSVTPKELANADRYMSVVSAAALGSLLYTGFLGVGGSYLAVHVYLLVQTVNHMGKDYISAEKSSSGFKTQMTIWHNLLAIWLWRVLVSTLEGFSIPGVVSFLGWVTYHLPSYYLWVTGFFVLMLGTPKIASGGKAATWYAKWLAGSAGSSKPSKSSSSSGGAESSSSSRPSGSSSSRESSGKSRRE